MLIETLLHVSPKNGKLPMLPVVGAFRVGCWHGSSPSPLVNVVVTAALDF
jgi:hypothetical protein